MVWSTNKNTRTPNKLTATNYHLRAGTLNNKNVKFRNFFLFPEELDLDFVRSGSLTLPLVLATAVNAVLTVILCLLFS